MDNKIYFSDYIEILTSNYDTIIYSPVYSNKHGLYLIEDERPIKELLLMSSRLTVYYLDGEEKTLDDSVMSIVIEDTRFKRITNHTLSGNLIKYDIEDAIIYNLDVTKAYDYRITKPNIKKRTIE